MLKPHMVVLLNQNILHGELLSPRPPHDGFRYFYWLFIGQRDGQREGFPRSHGQITGESPTGTGKILDCALAMEWPRVVGINVFYREAAVWTKREGHRGLAGWRIVGGVRRKAQGPVYSVDVQTVSFPASDLLSGLPVDQIKRYASACSLDQEAVHGPCKLLLSVNRHSKKRRTNSYLDA